MCEVHSPNINSKFPMNINTIQPHTYSHFYDVNECKIPRKNDKDLTMREFLIKVFETLHPGKRIIHNWHLDLIIEYLKALESGDIKRLIVNLPPRSLKSICMNVAWPAWLLGHAPNTRIITVSYNQNLSEKHATDCRIIMQTEWYQKLFPDTIITRGMNAKNKFCTTQHGFRLSTSTGGTLTGEGADVIILDDPSSAVDMFSYKKRCKTYEWFKTCLLSRLNDSQNGKIILVMQRLHNDDLSGCLLRSESKNHWKALKIPAIATRNETISFGNFRYIRAAGEHLYANAMIRNKCGDFVPFHVQGTIKNYIQTPFRVVLNDMLYSANMGLKNANLVSYKLSLPYHDTLWQTNISHINLFYDTNILHIYSKFYCGIAKMPVKQPNYNLILEHYLLSDDKKMLNSSNYDCGINVNFNVIQQEVGSHIFDIQYQQEVNNTNNTIIKECWLQWYVDCMPCAITNISQVAQCDIKYNYSENFEYVYQSWDCAIKCNTNSDYSVCSSWGVKDHKLYLLHILRVKIDYPKLRQSIINMSKIFNPAAILIEDSAAGQQIIQENLATNNTLNIISIKPRDDKITRLTLTSPLFERGLIYLPKNALWLNDLRRELLYFPETEHDDQVDSISQFLLWYQKNEVLKEQLKINKYNYKLNKI